MTIHAMYVSPTHTTQKVVTEVAKEMAAKTGGELKEINATLPEERANSFAFSSDDILVFGLPVYGGRIPGFTEDMITNMKGDNTKVVLCAVYGNRHFDDALLEMRDLLHKNGFVTVAAGAFIGEHSFTDKVGTARPDEKDLQQAREFGQKAADKATNGSLEQIEVYGNNPYKERGPAAPVAPRTTDDCYDCMLCAKGCPVGAISFDNPREVDPNKCVKCCACVRVCPVNAKTFDDKLAQSVAFLEGKCADRREPEFFF